MELSPSAAPVRAPKKAAFASWIGSAVEYYDFFIYGTAAALVFGKIFFPSIDPKLATVAAFATFGVGYVTRPIGAFFMGHIGDKFGRRKRVLMMTLLLMGASTFAIGLLPTYNQVGIAAPILLVVLRLLQGLSAAGEQAGANSMTLEHAPDHRRAFFTSFTLSGHADGVHPGDDRLPADLHAQPSRTCCLGAGACRSSSARSSSRSASGCAARCRRRLPSPRKSRTTRPPKMPLAELFQKHTPDVLRVVFAALVSVVSTIFGVFVLSYAVNTMHLPRTQMLLLLVCTNIVALAAIPLWAMLSDRIGRRPVFLIGAIGCAIVHLADAVGDRTSRRDADLRLRAASVGRDLQRRQRRLAVALRRDVRHPRAPFGNGDRHPDRLRARRLRADHQRGDHGRGAERLDAGRGPRQRRLPHRCDLGASPRARPTTCR